jgi:hypothetical protein
MQNIFYLHKREEDEFISISEWVKSRFNVDLPEDFLFFLKNNGTGGGPIPRQFKGMVGMYRLKIEEFLRLSPAESLMSIQYSTARAIEEGWMSDNQIMFAEGGGSHLSFTLAIKGPHRGKVFAFVDEGVYLEGDQIRLENGALHLADSFGAFIDGLYADEDDIDDWEDSTGYLPEEIAQKFGK